MKLSRAWTVASNDFGVFRRKKYTLYSLIGIPVVVALGLPIAVWLNIRGGSVTNSEITVLLNAFSFLFAIVATLIPTVLASYSFLGEKLERSLEPLLATPATDGDLLLGKCLASFLPSLAVSYASAAIFMAFADQVTRGRLGYLFFPNETMEAVVLIAIPLACLFSVEANLIIASLVGDLRSAQQLGTLASVPFAGVFILAETNFTSLNQGNLLVISVLLLLIDVVLIQVCRGTFRREEILTRWK
jgi:ABC-type Na+ efflux pump permease subunit